VEDFNMLCSLGVFNAPLMNDAIFKFKRYEDASLTYTGIDKHADDEVGGWDTTIRRTQYEKLFYNQQASMTEVDYSSYTTPTEPVEKRESSVSDIPTRKPKLSSSPVALASPTLPSKPAQTEDNLKELLDTLDTGSKVFHKKFGKGIIVNMNEKFIHVKFTLGEKKFVFPDAFLMGFLEVE
jgi:hypothetical protein